MDQQRRYRKKDGWNDVGTDPVLRNLVRDEPVRYLIWAAVGPKAAIPLQLTIDPGKDFRFARARLQPGGNGIERSIHVECWTEHVTRNPQDSKALVVGKNRAATTNFIYVLRRK